MTLFNGALPDGAKMGGKEGYAVQLRDPTTPAVSGEEFLRLAEDGHVAGVLAFTTAPKNKGQVDAPRHVSVRGVAWWRVVNVWCVQMMMLVCDGEGGGWVWCSRECVHREWSCYSDEVVENREMS